MELSASVFRPFRFNCIPGLPLLKQTPVYLGCDSSTIPHVDSFTVLMGHIFNNTTYVLNTSQFLAKSN